MPEILLTGLAFVLGGFWLFWGSLIVLCVGVAVCVDRRDYFWSTLWLGLAIFAIGYHFVDLGAYALANPIVMLTWVGIYFVGGMVTSIWKWYYVATDSKGELNNIRKRHTEYLEKFKDDDMEYEAFEAYVSHRMYKDYTNSDNAPFAVKELNGKDAVVVNTSRHPIPEWILFWPYTICSVVFRPLWSIAVKLSKRLGRLYDTISARILSAA